MENFAHQGENSGRERVTDYLVNFLPTQEGFYYFLLRRTLDDLNGQRKTAGRENVKVVYVRCIRHQEQKNK